ncbi:carbohydrate ABC transporter permease [Egicoccus sp. AB-alg2]|uniref:carbohydrate ABC transporter permease n=1 Tax=Egicoccus sp. AB-alg2 TaxID=3242693 RepID=UPI00359DE1C0
MTATGSVEQATDTQPAAPPRPPAPAVPPRRRRRTGRVAEDRRAAWLFLSPWFAGLALITIGPILGSLYLSFTDYSLLTAPEWTGLDNYRRMLDDPRFWTSLRVTFTYVFVSVPLQLGFALLLAMVLNRGVRGLPIYRSIYYLPSLLGSSVAIAILWRRVFGAEGLVNSVLAIVGIQGPGWVSHPDWALSSLIVLNVWTFGSPMVIFLAGLRQIPTMYYEAAQVDGAGAWQQFRRITLPLLTPIIFFNLVLQLINAFQSFTQAFIVSGGTGGPADSTLFYTLYLYQRGFGSFDMGYASALAWVLLLIVAGLTAVNFLASKYWVFYGDE